MSSKNRFVFFGDSWFWVWAEPKSETLRKYLSANKHPFCKVTSLYSWMLSELGIEFETFNVPGMALIGSVEILKSYIPQKNDILILFVSSPERCRINFPKRKFNVKDKDEFMKQWYDLYHACYQQISDYVDEHNVPLLLVGGHTNVHAHLLRDLSKKIYSIESITRSLTGTSLDYGTFGLQRDWTKDMTIDWDPKLVDFIHSQIESWDKFTETDGARLFWPDNGHMNHTGQFLALDYIFKVLEKNKLIRPYSN